MNINKDYIFVDFFDTIVFRRVHPLMIPQQWAIQIVRKIAPYSSTTEVLEMRNNAFSELVLQGSKAPRCDDIYAIIFDNLENQYSNIGLRKEAFVTFCHHLERAIEIGAQFPNKHLINQLHQLKRRGSHIVIVSDFHMGKEDISTYLKANNIDDALFDDIFVSCDVNASKKTGDLYDYVLNSLKISGRCATMIGDNRQSDIRMASNHGLSTIHRPHYIRKAISKIKLLCHYNYSRRVSSSMAQKLFKYNSPFTEYIVIFYAFTQRLTKCLSAVGERNIFFLAREGHFMRRCFDEYCALNPAIDIESHYFKCSRRAALSLNEDSIIHLLKTDISFIDFLKALGYTKSEREAIVNEIHSKQLFTTDIKDISAAEISNKFNLNNLIRTKIRSNREAFDAYTKNYRSLDSVSLVDIGWVGSMQETIKEILGKKVEGYYLGLNGDKYEINSRHGLIFEYCPSHKRFSNYASILRTNIQLYEQLAAAPHGSALTYNITPQGAIVAEEWAENEKHLYFDIIERKQIEMLHNLSGLTAWEAQVPTNLCAKIVLKAALFADQHRLDFLRRLDSGFIWNFKKESKGITYNKNSVQIKLDILAFPAKYLRYFAKVQRLITKKWQKRLYPIIAKLFYFYTLFTTSIKSDV